VKNHTPLQGRAVSTSEADRILPVFLERYRVRELNGIPSNLPTACTLDGVENESVLDSNRFLSQGDLYILFEYPRKLFVASPKSIVEYLRSKEPWEDYDVCIFSADLSWCVGVTHNDQVILVDKAGQFAI